MHGSTFLVRGYHEYKETTRPERKEDLSAHMEKSQIYKTVRFPMEVKPEGVKATLKNGILEVTLPKAEVVKKVKIEVKSQ